MDLLAGVEDDGGGTVGGGGGEDTLPLLPLMNGLTTTTDSLALSPSLSDKEVLLESADVESIPPPRDEVDAPEDEVDGEMENV